MLAVIVLFDRFTALDAVGPYEVLSTLPGRNSAAAPEAIADALGARRTSILTWRR